MFTDYVLNSRGIGEVGEGLQSCRFDPNLLRPYVTRSGKKVCAYNTGQFRTNPETGVEEPVIKVYEVNTLRHMGIESPVFNATVLRKDEWQMVDRQVIQAARPRLRAYGDLRSRNSFGGFNAMGKMVLEHETASDPGFASVDMDGLSQSPNDAPRYQLEGLPLPITHGDFFISRRQLMVSRNTGTPIDINMGESVSRRVAEEIEKTTIGSDTGATYGVAADYGRSPTVYGYTNFPARITKVDMTAPTGSNGQAVLTSWLALRDLLYDANFYGPYVAYTSTDYDQYLDNLFSTAEPSAGTLRKRLLEIDGISSIKRLDYLTDTFTVILVQMTPDVARAIDGMDLTTVMWESRGGMQINFKVMAIQVPQLRADFNGNCGIAHGTTA